MQDSIMSISMARTVSSTFFRELSVFTCSRGGRLLLLLIMAQLGHVFCPEVVTERTHLLFQLPERAFDPEPVTIKTDDGQRIQCQAGAGQYTIKPCGRVILLLKIFNSQGLIAEIAEAATNSCRIVACNFRIVGRVRLDKICYTVKVPDGGHRLLLMVVARNADREVCHQNQTEVCDI